ncbi:MULTISPECIES: molecular chaperone [Acinetobacter]|uniref:fimbrial biogenesis chaperone n=1 Tax=Acinetobacter TaxID=469 RepID=UPI00044F656E|nr:MULTISPECIES: fimbria/pilus periplasmic chaperone [Acinetobacter]SSR40178.1 fimbrial chaperone protein [Acinetobacter baumannii]EXR33925.1 gram-negative pili assembly chaperone, N-terminal domain protein [Acinetobacter sp. 1179249]MBJ8463923.1 molecular chaperone [Acinetobacter nosocomialis]MBP1498187.1 molecular chaperone [Acinetobacter nosocomialis]MBR7690418.1 molecular chaperone [Acinetobacter nosocomialis]
MKKNIFVATILLLFLPSVLNAASIRLSPVNVEILSDQSASSISLYNQSNESADLQIRIFEWTQNAGQDQLIPTDDIAISPPFLKLKPNDSYNLRVVRIKPEPISGEKTYRIILDELPKPIDSRKASQGVNVLLRSSLPVFVVNKDAITQLNWKIDAKQNDTSLNISNIGNRHALLNDLILVDNTENKSYPIKVNTVNGYILSGKSKNYSINNFTYQPNHKYSISLTVNGKKTTL